AQAAHGGRARARGDRLDLRGVLLATAQRRTLPHPVLRANPNSITAHPRRLLPRGLAEPRGRPKAALARRGGARAPGRAGAALRWEDRLVPRQRLPAGGGGSARERRRT